MRWLLLPLVLLAAAAGYVVAVKLHTAKDRRKASGDPRPVAVERLLRMVDDRPTPTPTAERPVLSKAERVHPWAEFVFARAAQDVESLWNFAEEHDGTAPGARALQLWTQHGAPEDRTRRRGIFRKRYPRSWILNAWDAEERR